MKKYICHCGNTLTKGIQPDEAPDGTILGYPIWECDKCGDVFDEEDLKNENIEEVFTRDCDEDDNILRERIKKSR